MLQELQDSKASGEVYVFGPTDRRCLGLCHDRDNRNLGGNVMSRELTDAQIVKAHKPKPVFYTGTEKKKMARPCLMCGDVIQGTLETLEGHVSRNHPKVVSGYDYTNQAWILDGVYVRCGHPEVGERLPDGQQWTGCQCYGLIHEGEAPMVGASIH